MGTLQLLLSYGEALRTVEQELPVGDDVIEHGFFLWYCLHIPSFPSPLVLSQPDFLTTLAGIDAR